MACKRASVALLLFSGARAQDVDGNTLVNDLEHIAKMNAVPGVTWKAGVNEFFNGMTFDDAKVFLGTTLNPENVHPARNESVYAAIKVVPAGFDSNSQWPGLVHPIRNQQQCGSCWAFSATEVLSDRFSIALQRSSPVLSAEDMVSCDRGDMGCNGGQLPKAWEYLTNTGIVTDTCFPYSAGSGTAPQCETSCADSEAFTKFKAQSAYAVNGVDNMQKEVMTHGPIQAAFKVYSSFMSYKSGVYSKHIWELLPKGGHAIKIVGWGTEDGSDYWLVANSWGATWGLDGYFKIVRGTNACGIESMGPPYAGLADTGVLDAPSMLVV